MRAEAPVGTAAAATSSPAPALAAPGQPALPWRAALAAAALYALVWSLLPPLLESSFPLDVVESLTWGREWQWGYYKHPPLSPWALHVFHRAFGDVGPFLLSQTCIAATLWLVWLTGRRLVDGQRAFIGTALTLGVVFYTRPALEFNHNIAQMPLWAALAWAMLAALQDGRLRQWLLLGLLAGLGMLTKYSMAIILACLALYLLASPARRTLLRPGPWLALLVLALVLAPHLWWLQQSGWLPMSYASERSATSSRHPHLAALGFLGVQVLNHVPLLVIALVAALRARTRVMASPEQESGRAGLVQPPSKLHTAWPGYLLTIALLPGLLVTLLGLVLGLRIRDMWGVPMWAFSGLLLAAWLPHRWLAAMRAPLLRGVLVWLALATLLSLGWLAWGAQWRGRPARTDWPQAALAAQAQAQWAGLSHCPLRVVAGNYWLAGLVAVPAGPQTSVLITGDARYSPWVTRARLLEQGALWLREGNEADEPPAPLDGIAAGPDGSPDEAAGMVTRDGTWQLPWPHAPAGPPLVLHWRIYVPAACARVAAGDQGQQSSASASAS